MKQTRLLPLHNEEAVMFTNIKFTQIQSQPIQPAEDMINQKQLWFKLLPYTDKRLILKQGHSEAFVVYQIKLGKIHTWTLTKTTEAVLPNQ